MPAVTAVLAKLMVPVVVIGPPVSPVPVATFVTDPVPVRVAQAAAPETVVNTCPLVAEGAIFPGVTAPRAMVGSG